MISSSTMWLPSCYSFSYNSIIVREHTLSNFNFLKCMEAFCWSATLLIGEYFLYNNIMYTLLSLDGPERSSVAQLSYFGCWLPIKQSHCKLDHSFLFLPVDDKELPLSHRFSLEEGKYYGRNGDHADLGCFYM